MRVVRTEPPSFPVVAVDSLLDVIPRERWQVLCGDAGHWRLGAYSPPQSRPEQIDDLERHDCPELFVLMSGRVNLVLSDGRGGTREVPLEFGKPILVEAPHSAYCPDGPHTGTCLVVERDAFMTEYRTPAEWIRE
jgi:hypothetical protein